MTKVAAPSAFLIKLVRFGFKQPDERIDAVPTKPPTLLRISRHFDATPEQVFDAWLAPEINSRWLFNSGGERVANEIDARPGGAWIMTDRREGKDYTACGEYQEINRPKKLVFTFAIPQFSLNRDRITIELVPDSGGCLQTFSQEGKDIAAELKETLAGEPSGSELGWQKMFDGLEAVLAR